MQHVTILHKTKHIVCIAAGGTSRGFPTARITRSVRALTGGKRVTESAAKKVVDKLIKK